MERYAQLSNNVVMLVIESGSDPDGINGEWVACGTVGPGWVYDPQTETFSEPLPPPPDAWVWFIDLGPFYDRFGATKMAVLTSTDAGVKAIMQDVSIRKWVDLQRADVVSALAYIGSVVPSVTPAIQTTILTTPVTAEENRALRKLYF